MLLTFIDSAASHTVSSGSIVIKGEDITSLRGDVNGFSLDATLLTKSLSVIIPIGEFSFVTTTQPIFLVSIKFAASLIVEEESNEATSQIITSFTKVWAMFFLIL